MALFIAQAHCFPCLNSYIRNTFDIHDAGNRTLRQWNLDMTKGQEISKICSLNETKFRYIMVLFHMFCFY